MLQDQTAATPAEIISQAVQSYSVDVSIAKIEEMKVAAAELSIANEDDKVGYKLVDEARKEVKRVRLAVTNREKQLLELPKNYTKAVRDEAKKYVDLLKPIEDALTLKQKAIDDIKAERERRAAQILQDRVNYCFSVGLLQDMNGTFIHPSDSTVQITRDQLKSFSNEEINEFVAKIDAIQQKQQEAEAERQRQAQADAESARQAAQAAAQIPQQLAPMFTPQQTQAYPMESATMKSAQPGFSETNVPQPSQMPPGFTTRQQPQPQTPTSFDPNAQMNGYQIGFNEAKRQILEILADPNPIKRSELFTKIQNLKP